MLATFLDSWYFYWSWVLKYSINHKTQTWSNNLNNSTEWSRDHFSTEFIVKMDQYFAFRDWNQYVQLLDEKDVIIII